MVYLIDTKGARDGMVGFEGTIGFVTSAHQSRDAAVARLKLWERRVGASLPEIAILEIEKRFRCGDLVEVSALEHPSACWHEAVQS